MKQDNGVNQFVDNQKITVASGEHYRIGWEVDIPERAWKRIEKLLIRGKSYTVNMAVGKNKDHVSLCEDPTYPECVEIHPNHFTAL